MGNTDIGGNDLLIDGERLRIVLEKAISRCDKKLLLISAYVTKAAIDWVCKIIPKAVDVHIVCRLLPQDISKGSTDILSLNKALELGWSVSCLHSLHAKIYSIDDQDIYVGSANLTSNGLKIYGSGNLEACTKIGNNLENLKFINNVEQAATPLTTEILNKMWSLVEQCPPSSFINEWPEDLFPDNEGIWVKDFFWHNPDDVTNNIEAIDHDLELIGSDGGSFDDEETRQRVSSARCVRWLLLKLEESNNNELYFGNITSLLHEELQDDPGPYRKNIKILVSNLLAYCHTYLRGQFEVTRPRHSERVKLIVNIGFD